MVSSPDNVIDIDFGFVYFNSASKNPGSFASYPLLGSTESAQSELARHQEKWRRRLTSEQQCQRRG
jgi:hypothetical protein